MISYRELLVELDSQTALALSDELINLGALSVSLEDVNADTPDEQPLFGEPGMLVEGAWQRSRVIALIGLTQDPLQLLCAAAEQIGLTPVPTYQTREIAEENWVERSQAQFEPILVGQRIWVVPSWHQAPDPDALIIHLDPGLAFGTGTHPTTRLCMEWLEATIKPGHKVLDYGCGSGILAILAKKCGAAQAVGIDIDPQALEAARYNSERNHASVDYLLPNHSADNATTATDTQHQALSAEFDVVVANILSNPLKHLAPQLTSQVRKGGWLALSGILIPQIDEVIQAYQPWLKLSVWRTCEDWACLIGQK